MSSLFQTNLQTYKDTLKKYPNVTHMYIRRNDPNFNGSVIDVPVKHVLITLKVNPTWELLMSTNEIDDIVTDLFPDDPNENIEKESYELFKEDEDIPKIPEPISDKEFEEIIKDKPTTENNPLKCEICGFVAKNKGGLAFHMRKHK
jgi:hypothetical protein